MLTISTTLLLAFAPAPAPVPTPSTTAPNGPQPLIQFVQMNEKNELIRMVPVVEAVPVTVTETRNVNGKEVTVAITKYEMRTRMIQSTISFESTTFFDVSGKEVRKDDLPKSLKGGMLVVVSSDGKPVDPAYLKVFKEGTLVLVIKQTNPPVVPVPVPPMPLPK